MNSKTKNIAASVHAKLLNVARERSLQFNLILPRYGVERLLYRLSRSPYSERFVLKGAMLFALWSSIPHRSTKDLDLLGYGDTTLEALAQVFKALCITSVEDDGLVFDPSSVDAHEIKSHNEYVGARITLMAQLGAARIPLQIDIGTGDAVIPPAQEVTYPTLLEQPAPRVKAYRMESVIAEKMHAMAQHGMQNTRMKDYYDLYYLQQNFDFLYAPCREAIVATFTRRRDSVPRHLPLGLTSTFSQDPIK
jgi:predicted nucleotidyltransferase component of viral defense system